MCIEHIIENFNEPGESLGCNPAKLCLVIKQSAKEAAVGEYFSIHILNQ